MLTAACNKQYKDLLPNISDLIELLWNFVVGGTESPTSKAIQTNAFLHN